MWLGGVGGWVGGCGDSELTLKGDIAVKPGFSLTGSCVED